MSGWRTTQYRVSRRLGRTTVRLAAAVTLGRMPSFVSASAIVTEEERILVVLDPVRREPVLPGGHLKWDEDPRDAVVREVREETGLVVRPRNLLGLFSSRPWGGDRGIVRAVYTAELVGGYLRSSPEGEALWLPVEEFLRAEVRDSALVRLHLDPASTAPAP